MIIVNQDKKAIHNFDNISSIQIEESNSTYKLIVYDQINDRDNLGEYETEKRAKEVLEEIVDEYSSYLKIRGGPAIIQGGIDIQPNVFNIPKVFKMPKE